MQKLTKEEAINLFRQMWTDMQTELGDCPDFIDRRLFKFKWCKKHFPDEIVLSNCPLCEYAYKRHVATGQKGDGCRFCPIDWPVSEDMFQITMDRRCITRIMNVPNCQGLQMHYLINPISEILALPEREVPDDTNETV